MALTGMELKLYMKLKQSVIVVAVFLLLSGLGLAAECRTAQLHLEKAGEDAAASHREITFTVQNQSSTACSLVGLPFVKLMNAANKATESSKPFNEQPADTRAVQVVLKPHQKASFTVRYGTSGPYDPGHCPGNSAKVSVLMHGNTTPLLLNLAADACTPLEVSPLQLQN